MVFLSFLWYSRTWEIYFFAQCKALRDKTFNIAKNRNYDGYQRAFVSLFYKFFNKKTSGGTVKNEVICNEELEKNYAKTSIRKFKKRNVHSSFIDNIWVADFKGFRFFLCVIDIYRKYAWVIPLKDTKWTTITKAFQKKCYMNQTANQIKYR